MQLNTQEVLSLYNQQGVDLEQVIGSPLMAVEKKDSELTFVFAEKDLSLNQIKQHVREFNIQSKMNQLDLVFPQFKIHGQLHFISAIDLETEQIQVTCNQTQTSKIITIDAARYYQHQEVIYQLRVLEDKHQSQKLSTQDTLRQIQNLFESIKKLYSFSPDLIFSTHQLLVRTIHNVISRSKIDQIEEQILEWNNHTLLQNLETIQECKSHLEPLLDLEILALNAIHDRLEHLIKKTGYKLETIAIINQTQDLLKTYNSETNPKPHLWFALDILEQRVELKLADLFQNNATIPQVCEIYQIIALDIHHKIEKMETESLIKAPQIKIQIQELILLAKPKTIQEAHYKLETILENLKLKNILHLQRSLTLSIFQDEQLAQHCIQIPELYSKETINIPSKTDNHLNFELFYQLHNQRIQWTQSLGVKISEELEYLSQSHPQEYYRQVHQILRQKKLAMFLNSQEEKRKASAFQALIEKIKTLT